MMVDDVGDGKRRQRRQRKSGYTLHTLGGGNGAAWLFTARGRQLRILSYPGHGPQRRDWLAGHVRLELKTPSASHVFEKL